MYNIYATYNIQHNVSMQHNVQHVQHNVHVQHTRTYSCNLQLATCGLVCGA